MSKPDIPVILHQDRRGLLSVEDGRVDVLQLSADGRPPKRLLSCPARLILRARLAPRASGDAATTGDAATAAASAMRRLDLYALGQRGAKSHALQLTKIHVLVEPVHAADAEEWVELVMAAAYPVTKPFPRVLLLVNPVGGKGKARSIVKDEVMPILEAAGCIVDSRETEYHAHAEEIARTMENNYDVIACASGDGIIHEVLNGLASRPDARKALRTPIAPIPTGSACACAINIFGVKDTFNVPLAALNVIKGQRMDIDLCSVLMLPSRKRVVSFLSQALGLMVDVDIGTENLRWMGDTRFFYGFLRGVAQLRPCKVRLRLDVVESDKEEMAAKAREAVEQERGRRVVGGGTDPLEVIRGPQVAAKPRAQNGIETNGESSTNGAVNGESNGHEPSSSGDEDGPLPAATELQPNDTWVTIESPGTTKIPRVSKEVNGKWDKDYNMLYLYSGTMPWVARDLNQWPVIRAGAGVIDLVVQRVVDRSALLGAISGAESGESFWVDSAHYFKVRAFTAENLDKEKQPKFTVDGEGFEWDSFHVQVLPRAATLLSLDGRYYHSDFLLKSPGAK